MIDRSIIPTRGSGEDSGSVVRRGTLRNLDAARIEILRSLDAFAPVADIFLEDAPQLLETIRRALAAGDVATAEQTAHRLKGSSANLGAKSLASSFRRLEALARDGDPDPCRRELERAEAEYRAVEAELEELRARREDP